MADTDVDIWMPLDIGKYLGDTQHLTTLQHGAYFLLLMAYWKRGPFVNDLEQLAAICKMDASSNAWSNAWLVLKQFFPVGDDGLLHNLKADKEIAKAKANRLFAIDRAKKGAEARWSKQSFKDASSNAQAMPQGCTSPLPIKTIKPSAKNAEVDSRHTPVREHIKQCFVKATGLNPAPWDGRDAKALQKFLANNQSWTVETIRGMVANRFRSDVPRGDPAHTWIPKLSKYANGPLDRFDKPVEGSNGANQQAGIGVSRQQTRVNSNREKLARSILGIVADPNARPGGDECEIRTDGIGNRLLEAASSGIQREPD